MHQRATLNSVFLVSADTSYDHRDIDEYVNIGVNSNSVVLTFPNDNRRSLISALGSFTFIDLSSQEEIIPCSQYTCTYFIDFCHQRL